MAVTIMTHIGFVFRRADARRVIRQIKIIIVILLVSVSLIPFGGTPIGFRLTGSFKCVNQGDPIPPFKYFSITL